jgi:prepilin-type N-terminal cleavage/methylation domain-containing protein
MVESMKNMTRTNTGFTLTELMITVLIIGIIAALSVPGFARFLNTWKLKGDADHFAAAVRTARAAAVTKNINTVFTFNKANGTFFYFEDADRDGTLDDGEYRSATYRLEPGIVFAGHTLSNPTMTFGSMGNTRESGSITLRNSYNRTRTVRIFGGTGNVIVD